ncbi:transposase family protein [Streptomyces sp. NBC_01637]|uniref:transposase family protein n=1 Tax=unclassified Streptomyces TaxID=2593676 RepID=UPI003866922A
MRARLRIINGSVHPHPRYLTGQLGARRLEIGTRRRRRAAGRQALLALALLWCGDTYARLAAAFGIGIATVYRSVREAVDVLAVLAPTFEGAESLRAAVREHHSRGCAVIKIMASGGHMTPDSMPAYVSQYGLEDLRVVVDEAHRLGLPVAAHAHGVGEGEP